MAGFELDTLHLHGSPAEMGRQQGLAFGRRLGDFVEMRFAAAREYLTGRDGATIEALLVCGQRCYDVLQRWQPSGVLEHEAMCAAAGVDPIAVFTAANMTDVRDVLLLSGDGPKLATPAVDREGCTAVMVPPDRAIGGEVIAGQTWDLNVGDLDYVVGLHRQPDNGPESWTVTVMGAPSLMGMNAHGVAVGTTNIKTWRSRPGVGYLNILHRALQCRSREEAAKVVQAAPRSGAHTYWLADAGGFVELEATPWSVTRRTDSDGPICHTNHCLDHGHRVLEGDAPTSSSSHRLDRAGAWLGRRNQDVASLRALFADRSDGVDSINRLPEDDQGTATNAARIAIPARLELWACRGPADRGIWRQLPFAIAGERGSIDT